MRTDVPYSHSNVARSDCRIEALQTQRFDIVAASRHVLASRRGTDYSVKLAMIPDIRCYPNRARLESWRSCRLERE